MQLANQPPVDCNLAIECRLIMPNTSYEKIALPQVHKREKEKERRLLLVFE
jgi:hypothetical protein